MLLRNLVSALLLREDMDIFGAKRRGSATIPEWFDLAA
jgi:hypothetical protein